MKGYPTVAICFVCAFVIRLVCTMSPLRAILILRSYLSLVRLQRYDTSHYHLEVPIARSHGSVSQFPPSSLKAWPLGVDPHRVQVQLVGSMQPVSRSTMVEPSPQGSLSSPTYSSYDSWLQWAPQSRKNYIPKGIRLDWLTYREASSSYVVYEV